MLDLSTFVHLSYPHHEGVGLCMYVCSERLCVTLPPYFSFFRKLSPENSPLTLTLHTGNKKGGSQSPPLKTSRITEIVRLSPPRAKGTLGLAENKHLDAFFSGFGACTQIVQEASTALLN